MEENCTEFLEIGPPPDMILTLPPPPLPSYLQITMNHSSKPCTSLCDTPLPNNGGIQFIELPPHALGNGELDDTWLFILISCSVGVLLLGSLLAILLLKCREERAAKTVPVHEEEEGVNAKKACEAVMYPGDSRMLWATLTPRGTTRHIAGHHLNTFENTGFTEEFRPRVSSPTRIEHPNLPPLNLPTHRTLRRQPPLL
ncbi:uncharacterized protein LOC106667854 isoform X2 [Cimex lectularius]|uniref:Uncharacterized protein n=1 Tax=Cimex lectularius TaxID=79782 RepID=A0A8I6SU09_CIMLE|nr:uncharacterized protein LOC106667854 isoform X2 [Cimex lectularius]